MRIDAKETACWSGTSQIESNLRCAEKTDGSQWWLNSTGRDWWSRKDCYDFDVIYFVIEGMLHIKVENNWYDICPGQMIYLPAGSRLEYDKREQTPLVKYFLHFTLAVNHISPMCSFTDGNILSVPEDSPIMDAFETLCSLPKGSSDTILTHISLMQIVSYFLSYNAQEPTVTDNGQESWTEEVISYIHEHYREKITTADLARQVGFSRDYFGKKFSAVYGCSPLAYITRFRIEQAQFLLRATDMSIHEIAEAVGISDSGYFSRLFKQNIGLHPLRYRVISKTK